VRSQPNADAYEHAPTPDQEARSMHWSRDKLRLLTSVLEELAPARLADIGGRSGAEALRYAQAAGSVETHVFDTAEAPLALARDRGLNAHLWVGGEMPCPMPDAYFDAVVVADVIEHVWDTDEFVSEIARITRPGGHVIITTPNLAWWRSRLRLLFGRIPPGSPSVSPLHSRDPAADRKHVRLTTADEWEHLLSRHELVPVRRTGYGYPDLLAGASGALDALMTRVPTLAHSLLLIAQRQGDHGDAGQQ
jgi:SAM-dependent methyltransferase